MKIQGGNNPHSSLHIDVTGRARTFATTQPEDKASNKAARVWSLYATMTPTAGAYCFYIKNTGEVPISITDVRSSAAAANNLFIETVSGTAALTGAVTAQTTTRHVGTSYPLQATVSAAASITGLTATGVQFFEDLPTAGRRETLSSTSGIIIPQGRAVAIRAVNANTLKILVSLVEELP